MPAARARRCRDHQVGALLQGTPSSELSAPAPKGVAMPPVRIVAGAFAIAEVVPKQ